MIDCVRKMQRCKFLLIKKAVLFVGWPNYNDMKYKIIALFFIPLLQSCEQNKEIDFDIPFEGEKIVLYGYITPDTFPYIEVLKTQPVIQETPDYEPEPENVIALLYEEDILIDTFVLPFPESAIWIAPHTVIKPNLDYRISVESEELEVLSEPVQTPEKVIIDSLAYEFAADSSEIFMQVFLTDPNPQKENYYFVNYTKFKNGEKLNRNPLAFRSSLSDTELEISPNSLIREESIVDADEIVIKLYHVSEEFVLFYDRAYGNEDQLGNQHSTQLPPWTNVNGGYGVVGSYQVDSIRLSF